MPAILLGCISEEGANRRKLARRGCGSKPFASPPGKERAQIDRSEPGQLREADFLAPMHGEKIDQPNRATDICANGVRRAPSVVLKVSRPARYERACALRS
jgi:hypothetical protein